MVAGHAARRCERVPLTGRYMVVDGRIDGEGDVLALVHHGGEHEVREGEDRAPLAYTARVEVFRSHFQNGRGRARRDGREPRAAPRGETVPFVEKILKRHNVGLNSFIQKQIYESFRKYHPAPHLILRGRICIFVIE